MIRVLINYSKYADGALESKAHTIINSLTDNADLPVPVEQMTILSAAATAYTKALVDANSGNRADIATKKVKRKELLDQLRKVAEFVNYEAHGDASKLLSSGFDLRKDAMPIVITKPKKVLLAIGDNSGEMNVKVSSVKGAKAYLYQHATEEGMQADNWNSITVAALKHTIANLQPGVRYYFRVGVVGSGKQQLFSDNISRIAA